MLKRILVAMGAALLVGIGLLVAHYQILATGDCAKPENYRISRFRGHVVGKSLGVIQYRWFRRQFTARGAHLRLEKQRPDTYYAGNLIKNSSLIGATDIDRSGVFDFGDLLPGDYSLIVKLPGEDAVGFGFSIDPQAHNTEVLIDASPGYYCQCCGWDFEPR